MERVAQHLPVQLPLWNELLENPTDFEAVYEGMQSAVDWPTAAFYQEFYAVYPHVRFILTYRSRESWAELAQTVGYVFVSLFLQLTA